MGEIVNKAKLAKILGKSERQLTTYQNEGMPVAKVTARGKANQYDTEKVIKWLIDRATRGDEMEAAKLRLTLSQAKKSELEVEELEGALIDTDTVEKTWTKMLSSFRERALAIPVKVAPALSREKDARKIQKLLKDTINKALSELSEYDPAHYKRAKSGAKGRARRSTAARAHANRVG